MNAQFKKGILEKCILLIVKRENSIYGYDLIKKIGIFFPEVNESTFYAILRRLEQRNSLRIQAVYLMLLYYLIYNQIYI